MKNKTKKQDQTRALAERLRQVIRKVLAEADGIVCPHGCPPGECVAEEIASATRPLKVLA